MTPRRKRRKLPRKKSRLNPEYLRLRIKHSPFKKTAIARILKVPLWRVSDWTQGRVRVPLFQERKLDELLDWGEMVYGRAQIREPKYLTEEESQ